jgi:hypothetical protein
MDDFIIDRKAILAVLHGDTSRLSEAFDFNETPQGALYWCNIADGHARLHDTARDFLRDILNADRSYQRELLTESEPEPDWRTEAAALRAQIADLTRRVEQMEGKDD